MYAKLITSLLFTVLLSACQSQNISDNKDHVKLGRVSWDKSSVAPMPNKTIASNEAKVVFIRPATNLSAQSSANIALNGRYLVSLQANHFTESLVCSGDAAISVLPTGVKSNDLNALSMNVTLQPQQTYFYLVDVDPSTKQPSITALTTEQAQPLLVNTSLQSHQISRVVNNCAMQRPSMTTAPTVKPAIAVNETPNIRLNIQFDHDQSVIKSQYQSEIARAAKFLANYSGADAVVEGHTDATGRDRYNQALSQRRAEAVRNALINQYAIDATRIRAIGYGETRPIADNTTAAGRQENRRVMIVIASPVN